MGGVGGEEAKEWSKGGGEEKTTFYFQSASGCAPWRGCHRNGEEKGAGKVRAGEERSGRGGEGARGRARGCGRAPSCRRPVAHHAVAVALLPSAQLPSPRGHRPIAAVTQLPSPHCPVAAAPSPSPSCPAPGCHRPVAPSSPRRAVMPRSEMKALGPPCPAGAPGELHPLQLQRWGHPGWPPRSLAGAGAPWRALGHGDTGDRSIPVPPLGSLGASTQLWVPRSQRCPGHSGTLPGGAEGLQTPPLSLPPLSWCFLI